MKQLEENERQLLAEMAGNLFSFAECAKALGIKKHVLKSELENEESEAYQIYWKAYMLKQVQLRKELIALAERGSASAVKQLIEILDRNNSDFS